METFNFIICISALFHSTYGDDGGTPMLDTETQNYLVDLHNLLRRSVDPTAKDMLKMEWSPGAALNAQNAAAKCVMQHSSATERQIQDPFNYVCGENIYVTTAKPDWAAAVNSWFNERNDFTYGVGPNSDKMIGHYTQVAWAKTYLLGCGLAFCPGNYYPYVSICHYCPMGNMINSIKTPYEAGEWCASCPESCEDKLCTSNPTA
ncbi:hypothetical protein XENTR_v10015128 [Xenopus tropicalis]|nr:hypothetical protein XENTR_v10015128 [Xenopus tropicalis]